MATKKSTSTKKITPATTKKSTANKRTTASAASTKAKASVQPEKLGKVAAARAASRRVSNPKAVTGFLDFLREQSVVGLAVGLVIGSQVKALADQLIASFINPLIGLVLPGRGALDQKIFILHFNDKTAKFAWGSFVAVLLSFMTTAAVVYFVFKTLKLDNLTKKKEDKK